MYIKFLDSNTPIKCSVKQNGNIVILKFADNIVVNESGFHCFLDKNCEYDISGSTYEKFTKVYRNDETTAKYNGYELSNDGSVYEKPIPTVQFLCEDGGVIDGDKKQKVRMYEELVIPTVFNKENYEFTGWFPEIPQSGEIECDIVFTAKMKYVIPLEEIKLIKKGEISKECDRIIYNGVDVNINGMIEHFSLTTNDQLNLFGKQAQIAAGVSQFEYHQDGYPCRYYSLEEMMAIIEASMEHVSFHTTYCNSLNMWIAGSTTKEEVEQIYYGAEIPEKYQSEVFKNYIANTKNGVEV